MPHRTMVGAACDMLLLSSNPIRSILAPSQTKNEPSQTEPQPRHCPHTNASKGTLLVGQANMSHNTSGRGLNTRLMQPPCQCAKPIDIPPPQAVVRGARSVLLLPQLDNLAAPEPTLLTRRRPLPKKPTSRRLAAGMPMVKGSDRSTKSKGGCKKMGGWPDRPSTNSTGCTECEPRQQPTNNNSNSGSSTELSVHQRLHRPAHCPCNM